MALTRSPASGQLTATSLASTTSTRTYNTFGEPTQEATTYPSGSYQEQYTRDALGRITTRTESSAQGTNTYAYSYDPAGRLTQVTLNANPYRAFAYDANGNRTQATKQTPSGPITTTATYDAQDRQTTSGDYALTYNDNGELTAKTNTQSGDTLALGYKTSDDLAKATTPTGTELTYKYDAFGNRTAEYENGVLKAAYLYAPGISGPIARVNQSGQEQARFIYATRSHVPDFMVQGSSTYRLITDQLGSIRQVVNASTGAVAQEIAYDPFGEVLGDSNPGFQPFGFAGGLYEPKTGLTHFGAREYDAELGRWTSSDPIGFAGGDTNLYGYVVQDPVNLIDPSGLFGLSDIGSAIGGAVEGAYGWANENWSTIATFAGAAVCLAPVSAVACLAVAAGITGIKLAHTYGQYQNGLICGDDALKKALWDVGSTALSTGPGLLAGKAFSSAISAGVYVPKGIPSLVGLYGYGLPSYVIDMWGDEAGTQLGLPEGF